jgi:hypothetical protein
LCSAFVVSIVVVTYGLIAEKRIAIEFARKELDGVQYLKAVRGVYAWILASGITSPLSPETGPSANRVLDGLADAQSHTAGSLHTAEHAQSVADAVRKLSDPANGEKLGLIVDALSKARNLASRIGDDSKFILDPDLDSYYVQDIVVTRMPMLLGQIGDGDRLRQMLDPHIVSMVSAGEAYLEAMRSSLGASDPALLNQSYARVVEDALKTWKASDGELDLLLNTRLSNLLAKLRGSLILNGLLAALVLHLL